MDEEKTMSNEDLAREMLKILYSKMVRADFSGKDTIIQLDDGKIAFIEIIGKVGVPDEEIPVEEPNK